MVNTLKYQKELESLKAQQAEVEARIFELMAGKVINKSEMRDLNEKKLLIKEAIAQVTHALSNGDSAA